MKKSLFSLAVLAVGLLMASCGNKSANNAAGGESENTEVAENLPELKANYEVKTFTAGAPEGWNIMGGEPSMDDNGLMLYKGDISEVTKNPCVIIDVEQSEEGKSFDDGIKEVEESGTKAIPDLTIDGKTYKGFEIVEGETKGNILCREEGGKIISVTLANCKPTDPEVLAILKSMKLK